MDGPVVGHHDDLVVACRWRDADGETRCEAEAVFNFPEDRGTADRAFIEAYIRASGDGVDRDVVAGDVGDDTYLPKSRTGIMLIVAPVIMS